MPPRWVCRPPFSNISTGLQNAPTFSISRVQEFYQTRIRSDRSHTRVSEANIFPFLRQVWEKIKRYLTKQRMDLIRNWSKSKGFLLRFNCVIIHNQYLIKLVRLTHTAERVQNNVSETSTRERVIIILAEIFRRMFAY